MDTHTAFRQAARLEYALLRAPLTIVDERVVRRYLDEDSPVRQSFERALDALDGAVGKLLTDPAEARYEPDEPDDEVEPPEPEQPQDDDDAPAVEDESEQIEHLTEELLDEEETETFVGELAEDEELRRVQAELQAKRLIEEQQEGR